MGVRYYGEGVLKNISARGVYIYAKRSLRVGEALDISINLPLDGKNWLVYSAEVVRVDRASDKIGLALKFNSSKPAFTAE